MLGHGTKFKDRYDLKKAKITAVLTNQCNVILLDGVARGQDHKYLRAKVPKIEDAPPPLAEAEASAQPDASEEVVVDAVSAITKEIDDL